MGTRGSLPFKAKAEATVIVADQLGTTLSPTPREGLEDTE